MKTLLLCLLLCAFVGCIKDNEQPNLTDQEKMLMGEWVLQQRCNCITLFEENQKEIVYDTYVNVNEEEKFFYRFNDGEVETDKYRNSNFKCDSGNFQLNNERITLNFQCVDLEYNILSITSDTLILSSDVFEGSINYKFLKKSKDN